MLKVIARRAIPKPAAASRRLFAFAPDPSAAKTPPPKYEGPQTIDIYFDFDKGVSFRHPADLVSVLERARAIGTKGGSVTGMRGAHRLSDGTLLQESPGIAQRRADEVAHLLEGAGLNVPLAIRSADGESEADGVDDWRSRRVTVVLEP